MIYVERFILPSLRAENGFISEENRTCFHTFYPFNVFPFKFPEEIEFDGITMFYGGNGSGKSTLINVMARKMHAIRFSEFNGAPLFDQYVEMCEIEYYRYAKRAYVLTSDAVFEKTRERLDFALWRFLQVLRTTRNRFASRSRKTLFRIAPCACGALSTTPCLQPYVADEIRRDYSRMLDAGATSVWETAEGARAFDNAGSLFHGRSAIPICYL